MEAIKIIKMIRRMPEPPTEVPTMATVARQVMDLPMLLPIRLFWNNLRAQQSSWPFLLPLLAWVGWRTYRRERARFLAEQDKSKEQTTQ